MSQNNELNNDEKQALYTAMKECLSSLKTTVRFAFHPVVSDISMDVTGFEALVRGDPEATSASVMDDIGHDQRFDFDQACRILALQSAQRFEVDGKIHLNCTALDPDNFEQMLRITSLAARDNKFEPASIVLEVSNLSAMVEADALVRLREAVSETGFQLLLDRVGPGTVDLRLIADLKPDWVKLDQALIRNIHANESHQAIIRGVVACCRVLNIQVMAGGVEQAEELKWLRDAGIRTFQGYYFSLPEVAQERARIIHT